MENRAWDKCCKDCASKRGFKELLEKTSQIFVCVHQVDENGQQRYCAYWAKVNMRFDMNCPNCNANLDAGPVPEKSRHLYASPRFSRIIGIYSLEEDRTVAYQCPDCKYIMPK